MLWLDSCLQARRAHELVDRGPPVDGENSFGDALDLVAWQHATGHVAELVLQLLIAQVRADRPDLRIAAHHLSGLEADVDVAPELHRPFLLEAAVELLAPLGEDSLGQVAPV